MKFQISTILAAFLLMGCSMTKKNYSTLPPLPDFGKLNCCWQSEETVTFNSPEGEHTFHAVVAVNDKKITVIVLDDFGRQMLTLISDDKGKIETLVSPQKWKSDYGHYLLLAIYLHNSPTGIWVKDKPQWLVRKIAERKSLYYTDKEEVTLIYQDPSDTQSRTRNVSFAKTKLTLTVSTINRTSF